MSCMTNPIPVPSATTICTGSPSSLLITSSVTWTEGDRGGGVGGGFPRKKMGGERGKREIRRDGGGGGGFKQRSGE